MKIIQVDAFTDKIFKGNPAAVCVLDKMPSDELMLNIALEMNLSETAYVMKENDGFRIKWFTPDQEEDLCGHATLSTAHVLYEQGLVPKDKPIKFCSRSGVLHACLTEDGVLLDFPAEVPSSVECPAVLQQEFNNKIINCVQNRLDMFIEIEDEDEVINYVPNLDALRKVENVRGIVLTAKSKNYDFVSRFFCPNETITEDPVTGSAHCGLTPFWAKKLEKNKMKARQCSKRGGELTVEIVGDRVKLAGKALTVMECEMKI